MRKFLSDVYTGLVAVWNWLKPTGVALMKTWPFILIVIVIFVMIPERGACP